MRKIIQSDMAYRRLLEKMLNIEEIGYELYTILSRKARDKNSKSVYESLARNERETASHIKRQLSDNFTPSRAITALARFIFNILPEKQLSSILRNILKKRMYGGWFKMYNHKDEEFWRVLIDHENRQHELLIPFWNKKE